MINRCEFTSTITLVLSGEHFVFAYNRERTKAALVTDKFSLVSFSGIELGCGTTLTQDQILETIKLKEKIIYGRK